MRLKQILFLGTLCGMLVYAGWMAEQAKMLEQKCRYMEQEIILLEKENTDLRKQYAEILNRMEAWLDEWEVDIWEATSYAPLDPRAIPGMCYAGDPRVTASGAEVIPYWTAAAGQSIPYGTLVRVRGAGFRKVTDRGSRIRDRYIDLAVATREEALCWGRRQVRVVYQK